jgi:ubiquinone/menaquinone biosynthesis C-methylase UbiE
VRLLSWAFERFYHEFAWTYDAVAWVVSRGMWYQWTLASLPYLRGPVLELGCGTGYMQNALAAAHPDRVVGLDESPQMLALTQQRASSSGRSIRVMRGVAQRLPFASGSFQSVLSTFPSDYIFHTDTLAEIGRVLHPTGRLVIVDAGTFTGNRLYEGLVALAYRLALLHTAARDEQPRRHFHQDMLERAGFTVEVHRVQIGRSFVHVFVACPRHDAHA